MEDTIRPKNKPKALVVVDIKAFDSQDIEWSQWMTVGIFCIEGLFACGAQNRSAVKS